MLDLWLLTCILLVFLIVIFHTLIEHYSRQEKGASKGKAWSARVDVRCVTQALKCSQASLQNTTLTTATTMDSLSWAAKVTLPVVFLIFLIAYIAFIIIFNKC